MNAAPPREPQARLLHGAVVACHALLTAAIAWLALSSVPASPAREVTALLAVVPLLAVVRGLVAGRRGVRPWLALLLVVYSGAASVEVVASAGAASAASAALLAATVELACLLVLIRRTRPLPRARSE